MQKSVNHKIEGSVLSWFGLNEWMVDDWRVYLGEFKDRQKEKTGKKMGEHCWVAVVSKAVGFCFVYDDSWGALYTVLVF